jgi:hypothetical protein
MAAQLDGFDRHFSGEAGKSSAELSSSEMQKLASLGYVGLQSRRPPAASVTGTDPKDKIATANHVIEAASARDQSKPDLAIARAIAALEPIVAAIPTSTWRSTRSAWRWPGKRTRGSGQASAQSD